VDIKIVKAYKAARKYLKLTQRKVAELVGVTHASIGKLENGEVNNPSWIYTKFLVENGINYFYLIGQSEEIKGQLVDTVSRKNYEVLQTELETLKTENEELKKQLEEMVSRAEFDQLAQKLETYAEIIQMLKK